MEASFVLDEDKVDLQIEPAQTVGAQAGSVVAGTAPEDGMDGLLHRTGARARQFIRGSLADLVAQRNGQVPSADRWAEFAHFPQRERALVLRADVANFDLADGTDRKLLGMPWWKKPCIGRKAAEIRRCMRYTAASGRVFSSWWQAATQGARIATKSSRDTLRRQRNRVPEYRCQSEWRRRTVGIS